MRTPNTKSAKPSTVRHLLIQPKFRASKHAYKRVPEITLCGNWLEKLGFAYGQRVEVMTIEGMLVIRREG